MCLTPLCNTTWQKLSWFWNLAFVVYFSLLELVVASLTVMCRSAWSRYLFTMDFLSFIQIVCVQWNDSCCFFFTHLILFSQINICAAYCSNCLTVHRIENHQLVVSSYDQRFFYTKSIHEWVRIHNPQYIQLCQKHTSIFLQTFSIASHWIVCFFLHFFVCQETKQIQPKIGCIEHRYGGLKVNRPTAWVYW